MTANNFYGCKQGLLSGVVVSSKKDCQRLVSTYPSSDFRGFRYKVDAVLYAGRTNSPKDPTGRSATFLTTTKESSTGTRYDRSMVGDIVLMGLFRDKERPLIVKGARTIGEHYKLIKDESLPWDI